MALLRYRLLFNFYVSNHPPFFHRQATVQIIPRSPYHPTGYWSSKSSFGQQASSFHSTSRRMSRLVTHPLCIGASVVSSASRSILLRCIFSPRSEVTEPEVKEVFSPIPDEEIKSEEENRGMPPQEQGDSIVPLYFRQHFDDKTARTIQKWTW